MEGGRLLHWPSRRTQGPVIANPARVGPGELGPHSVVTRHVSLDMFSRPWTRPGKPFRAHESHPHGMHEVLRARVGRGAQAGAHHAFMMYPSVHSKGTVLSRSTTPGRIYRQSALAEPAKGFSGPAKTSRNEKSGRVEIWLVTDSRRLKVRLKLLSHITGRARQPGSRDPSSSKQVILARLTSTTREQVLPTKANGIRILTESFQKRGGGGPPRQQISIVTRIIGFLLVRKIYPPRLRAGNSPPADQSRGSPYSPWQ